MKHAVGWLALALFGMALLGLALLGTAGIGFAQDDPPKWIPQIPVILDTDIGSDIDDTWALSFILCRPELDLRMVLTDSHDTAGRAKLAAQFLERVGQDHIPVGIGIKTSDRQGAQFSWAKDYDLTKYKGGAHEDGIGQFIDYVNSATETITLLVTGPCPNIPEILRRSPGITQKLRVIATSGSIDAGYAGSLTPDAEYNIRDNLEAARALYSANWDLTIAPLDTSAQVSIRSEKYQELYRARNPVFETLMGNYRTWIKNGKYNISADARSSPLYDCVSVYLAWDNVFCEMKTMNLTIKETGYTVVDPKGKAIHVALAWNELGKFEDLLWKSIYDGVPPHIEKPKISDQDQF